MKELTYEDGTVDETLDEPATCTWCGTTIHAGLAHKTWLTESDADASGLARMRAHPECSDVIERTGIDSWQRGQHFRGSERVCDDPDTEYEEPTAPIRLNVDAFVQDPSRYPNTMQHLDMYTSAVENTVGGDGAATLWQLTLGQALLARCGVVWTGGDPAVAAGKSLRRLLDFLEQNGWHEEYGGIERMASPACPDMRPLRLPPPAETFDAIRREHEQLAELAVATD